MSIHYSHSLTLSLSPQQLFFAFADADFVYGLLSEWRRNLAQQRQYAQLDGEPEYGHRFQEDDDEIPLNRRTHASRGQRAPGRR